VAEEAISALSILGFQPAAVRKVVAAILKDEPGLDVQQIIKRGLKEIK
ncbi:MAG: Holliday junction branch migration protein RuvA, partial [Bacteroidaceae bacterium]|nr:Holliday junction branch migration protein RuvA [Bacteroidaceae bacterium]